MIKIEHVEAYGWEAAIRGMRNPMNSWEKSDSFQSELFPWSMEPDLGPNDISLMVKLAKAGSDHSKFMRMISVAMDITAPLYWWKEYDTYKVGTVANSCSTMHRIHAHSLSFSDFSCEHLNVDSIDVLGKVIQVLNKAREEFCTHKDKDDWWQLIQLLPSSYNQKRTVLVNYAVLQKMYHARKHHKLDEWRDFCKVVELLPYAKELIVGSDSSADT